MFGDDAPPLEWDSVGRYGRGNLELYYLSNAATPLTKDALVEVGWVFFCGAWAGGPCMGPIIRVGDGRQHLYVGGNAGPSWSMRGGLDETGRQGIRQQET